MSDPSDPAIRQLEATIQSVIRQEAQDKWLTLLSRSDRRTNPRRYWSLLRKLSGKRSSPPPNISIEFDGKTHAGSKSIAKAFTKQFTNIAPHRQDPAMRRLMREVHRLHRLDSSFRPFDVRGVSQAIRKAGSSTASGPDGLTILHLQHLGASGLAFLTELFNLSVAGSDIPAIWKCSVLIPLLKPGKPRALGSSYRPISLLCAAVKVLERLVLPYIVEMLGTRPSQHGFKPGHSTISALLPLTSRITHGFNQLKPPGRTVAVAVDISKAFDTVSHRQLLEMIHHSQLGHNLVRWVVAYLRGRKAACIYHLQRAPFHHVRAGVPQGSVISPALFNHFVSDCPLPDSCMASYADDFTIFSTHTEIVTAAEEANRLTDNMVRWAENKGLAIAPHKSSVTLFTPDTHQSQHHPQVSIKGVPIPLNRTPKILGITLDTHLTFGPHIRTTISRATTSLKLLKALAGTTWGFSKETMVATYKACTRPILNYGAPLWQHVASTTNLDKLSVTQNTALRIATGNIRKAAIPHLHVEAGVIPLRTHLELCGTQFLASALQTSHPSHSLVTTYTGPRLMKPTLQSTYMRHLRRLLGSPDEVDDTPPIIFGGVLSEGTYPTARRRLRASAVARTTAAQPDNRVLLARPPPVDLAETLLPRAHRSILSQLRSGHCSRLASYRHSVGWSESPLCPDCLAVDHTVAHIFSCPVSPTDLAPADLWTAPLQVAQFLSRLSTFSDLPPLQLDFTFQPP